MTEHCFIHVAVGVIVNASNEVLISLRPAQSHQGGLWEFPGGKLEPGEAIQLALKRELSEELGIDVEQCHPLKKIRHNYVDKSVLLDVWRVSKFSGTPEGREGQAIEWRPISSLQDADFPAANAPIIRTLKFPTEIAITPDVRSLAELTALLENLLGQDLPIIQLRQKQLDAPTYLEWFEQAREQCRAAGTRLMFNQDLDIADQIRPLDYHASAARLMQLQNRPVDQAQLFSASCHTLAELKHAEAVDADFVFLSPVAATKNYNAEQILGWQGFGNLAKQVSIPVYALGGMNRNDRTTSLSYGGSGVAGISSFLPN